MKVLIVGGVAGGASAAARLRRLDENAEIILFEKGPYISFANCGLPYYLSRTIPEEDDLLLQTPESFFGRFCVDVRVFNEVTSIDRANKTVKVHRHDTGEDYEESYDKLILSPGALPTKPATVKGLDCEGVFTLRNVPDVKAIDAFIAEKQPKHATVVGGGYIGIELAENLRERGLDVTVVEFADHIINNLDREMAYFAQKEMEKNGVVLKLQNGITAIEKTEAGLKVTTTKESFDSDIVLLCVGITPNNALAKDAGLELGFKNCIVVDDKMRTSDPDIYAVGDVVECTHFVTGKKGWIALAGPANRQGRIAADQIAGIDSRYKMTQGTSIMKVFDIAAASTGLTEREAKAAGYDCDKIYLHSGAHAGYYPGGKMLTCKVVYERGTGKLLGGQFIGGEGADKRCDVLAVAIRAGMTAYDLVELELSYAPPFSSAKDPLNMAGFAIENVLTGKVKCAHWEDLDAARAEGATLLDVRTISEYAKGHVDGFVNIPLHELRSRLGELPAGKKVYVHCHSGLRSYVACRILSQHGFDCRNISGGWVMYNAVKG